ncbi:glycosyl hydrolase [Terriglobus albidus]|uniref:glycosyl hydrolase n=1 Tax=Terriglobus albidus TaxID=1592106 RepID=UPI0021E0F36F|nr:glycosyl hydrolase [Terriglobus albidus]
MKSLPCKQLLLPAAALAFACCHVSAYAQAAPSLQAIQQGFLSPPNEAKPMVRWWWFGPAVEKPEILRELQQMKADGIGGAELAFVYPQVLDDPASGLKNFSFLSPEMLDAVQYAQAEGRKLGLRIDVTLGSGWPYGGPTVTLHNAATRLRTIVAALPAGAASTPLPALKEGESLIYAAAVNGTQSKWDASTSSPATLDSASAKVTAADVPRAILFFVQSHTGQMVKRAAVGAEGWVLDPFSKEAVATHLKTVGEPLVKAFGNTPPYAIFSDSLEAYGADWTPTLPEEFRKRRGYDLLPHLPELVAGDAPNSANIRHDWGKTLTELVNEAYLVQINDWAKQHGTKFRSQTYGEPAVSLSSQKLVALPEGEGPQWRAFSTLRWASSGNHLFGNNVTSGETFTWLHSPVFRATPLDMKAEADIDFIMGENQLIFHGWPYSAPQVGEPGWSLYAAAVFNDHNPWHPVMPAVTNYIARLSYLMRQGKPANQVAVLLPTDDAWAAFRPTKVTVTGAMQDLLPKEMLGAILSAGYNFDFTDAEAIDRLGVQHSILLLPPTTRIPVSTLKKIAAFKAAGGKVVAYGHLPTLTPEGRPSAELTELASNLFPAAANTTVELTTALHQAAVPDLSFDTADFDRNAIGFIRRKLSTGDIYFLTNTSNREIKATVSFATSYASGVALDPETGHALPGTFAPKKIVLTLAPYESRTYLFGNGVTAAASKATTTASTTPIDLSHDWSVSFTGTGKTETQHTLADWTSNEATLHYSGEAVYSRGFRIERAPTSGVYLTISGGSAEPGAPDAPPSAEKREGIPNPLVTRTGPGTRAWYNPPVREGALLVVNGKPAGALWHPPYRLDIAGLLKSGENKIEIYVYNTALNAWSALPPHDYEPLIEKYGDRFQMQDLDKVKPVPSGILGNIELVFEAQQ